MTLHVDELDFRKGRGLVTVVTQDSATGSVLMVAGADEEAVRRTLSTGEMHYHSRTRGLWRKGESSGNTQKVVSLSADCDGDAVLARVTPAGPACHTGSTSCFTEDAAMATSLSRLDRIIATRASDLAVFSGDVEATAEKPTSYTQRLLLDRNARLKKIGEEAAELAVACADSDRNRAVEECADLIYHALVALHAVGGCLADVQGVLAKRER